MEELNAAELTASSFGQTLTTTMLQMAAGYASLVNGGSYYQPRVVKEILNDQNATVKKIEPLLIRRTVSEETCELLRRQCIKQLNLELQSMPRLKVIQSEERQVLLKKFPEIKVIMWYPS